MIYLLVMYSNILILKDKRHKPLFFVKKWNLTDIKDVFIKNNGLVNQEKMTYK